MAGHVLPRHYIMGIVIFTIIMIGGMSLLYEFDQDDATFTDDEKFAEFNRTFNTMEDITDETSDLRGNIEDSDTDFGTFGVLNSLISGAWQSLRLLFTSFSFMDDVFNGISTVFGVPSWIPALVILLVTIMIAFAIFTAVFQREI